MLLLQIGVKLAMLQVHRRRLGTAIFWAAEAQQLDAAAAAGAG